MSSTDATTGGMDSQVPALADYLNSHTGITVDVGQVLFGDTTSMTADGAVGQFLHSVTGRKWISQDVEQAHRIGAARYGDADALSGGEHTMTLDGRHDAMEQAVQRSHCTAAVATVISRSQRAPSSV